jgi:hypothetical protein
MTEIKKIRRLKRQQLRYMSQFEGDNSLSFLTSDYVSKTGLTLEDITEKIDRVKECATLIELKETFHQVGKNPNNTEQILSVSAANYCKQPNICTICAQRVSQRRKAIYGDPIKEQAEMCNETYIDKYGKERKKRYAYMITYTIADGPSLSERLNHLKESKKAFRKMGQRRSNKKRSGGESSKIVAAISTTEIKRGKNSGYWHAHCHDLVFTDSPINYRVYDRDKKKNLEKKYGKHIPENELLKASLIKVKFKNKMIPVSKVSFEWLRATGGDSIDISIDRIRHIPKSAKGKKKRMFQKMSYAESVNYQAKECLKYPLKPGDLDVFDSVEMMCETYNKRLLATYGEFYGIKNDDLYNEDIDENERFVMSWSGNNYDNPLPGTVRELQDDTEARKRTGMALGEYRRARRKILDKRNLQGDLWYRLNDLKRSFRSRCSKIWNEHRERVKRLNLLESSKCDTYSSTLALSGSYSPGFTSEEIRIHSFLI